MKTISIVVAAWVAISSTGLAAAAESHEHGTAAMAGAHHGGQLRMAGAWHFELVVKKDSREVRENPIVLYLTDHAGKPVATAGASGKALVRAAGMSAEVTLRPDGENRLRGLAKYASDPGISVAVTVTVPGQGTEQARFAPLAPR